MKKKNIDVLHDRVCALCVQLRDDTGFLMHLNDLLYGVIELARTGKTVQALGVAREVASYLAEGHSRSVHNARQSAWAASMKAQPGSSVGIGTVAPAWNLGVERMRIHSDGYVQVHHDAPRPAATVEQMRAAADAAMAADEEMDEYECDSCHKTTLVPMDSGTPKGWQPSDNPDGEEYICNECHTFGGKP